MRIIEAFNQAQIDNEELRREDVSSARVADIKHRTGGYLLLAIYTMALPEVSFKGIELPTHFDHFHAGKYRKSVLENQAQSLFNLGAAFIGLDDLHDEYYDRKKKMRTLATTHQVTWDQASKDAQRAVRMVVQPYDTDSGRLKQLVDTLVHPQTRVASTVGYVLQTYIRPITDKFTGVKKRSSEVSPEYIG